MGRMQVTAKDGLGFDKDMKTFRVATHERCMGNAWAENWKLTALPMGYGLITFFNITVSR
jgi:hypothetical protein